MQVENSPWSIDYWNPLTIATAVNMLSWAETYIHETDRTRHLQRQGTPRVLREAYIYLVLRIVAAAAPSQNKKLILLVFFFFFPEYGLKMK